MGYSIEHDTDSGDIIDCERERRTIEWDSDDEDNDACSDAGEVEEIAAAIEADGLEYCDI